MKIAPRAKQILGSATAAISPQARFENCIFMIGHMRCGTTALSNILCSRPEVSGYGEAHVNYGSAAAPGVLILNQIRRRAWKPAATHLFDKILHSAYDRDASPGFFSARAIFICRSPEASIGSIVKLFQRVGDAQYATRDAASAYYAGRVEAMLRLWERFPATHRVALTYEALRANPELQLNRLSNLLGFDPPLANSYSSHRASSAPGAGDPFTAPGFSSIIAGGPEYATLTGDGASRLLYQRFRKLAQDRAELRATPRSRPPTSHRDSADEKKAVSNP